MRIIKHQQFNEKLRFIFTEKDILKDYICKIVKIKNQIKILIQEYNNGIGGIFVGYFTENTISAEKSKTFETIKEAQKKIKEFFKRLNISYNIVRNPQIEILN